MCSCLPKVPFPVNPIHAKVNDLGGCLVLFFEIQTLDFNFSSPIVSFKLLQRLYKYNHT